MYGSGLSFLLRPKWLGFHLLVFGSIAVMLWLASWQLDRLDERRAFNDTVAERIEQPPVPLDELLADTDVDGSPDPEQAEWRQVIVTGTYLPDQILWFNRSQDGVAGDNVLTPLVTDDGTTVLVNRGFVLLGVDVPPAPSGPVEILARVREPQERQRGELTDADDAAEAVTEVRRIDLDQLAAQLPAPVAPVYLDLIDAVPSIAPTDPIQVPAPTLDEGPHLSYAVQWLIFATCVLIGWVLAIRRSIRTRRRRANDTAPTGDAGVGDRSTPATADALTDEASGPAPADSDRPAGVGSPNSTNGTGEPSPR